MEIDIIEGLFIKENDIIVKIWIKTIFRYNYYIKVKILKCNKIIMDIIINFVMLILLIGAIFTGILAIMAFADMECLRITRNKNIQSGINLLVTCVIFFSLFIYSYCMSNLQNKNDESKSRKVSVYRRSTVNIKKLDQSQLTPIKNIIDPINIDILIDKENKEEKNIKCLIHENEEEGFEVLNKI